MAEKNRVTGPLDMSCPVFMFNGLPLPLIADLPEGGFVQIISGDNPMGIPIPGPQLAKGTMLVVIAAEIAEQIRPSLKQAEAQQLKAIGKPYAMDGKVVPRSSFDQSN